MECSLTNALRIILGPKTALSRLASPGEARVHELKECSSPERRWENLRGEGALLEPLSVLLLEHQIYHMSTHISDGALPGSLASYLG